ncbi:MAG: TlpA family protein disulfide reductase [Halioglobus sp.]
MNVRVVFFVSFLLAACSSEISTNNRALDLSAHTGQWVLINYWAPWCKPCIEEIPELNAVHNEHDTITVYGVNFDGAVGETLRQQEQTLGVAFPTLTQDPSTALGLARPAALPTTLVIGPDGKLAATLLGPQTEQSLLGAAGQSPQNDESTD